jgi:type IV pilus assembly protein PilM
MVAWLGSKRHSPIGVDIGSRSVKLLQFNGDCSTVSETSRWDLPPQDAADTAGRDTAVVAALCHAREGRGFRGRDAVFSLGAEHLFVQNIRVAQAAGDELRKIVHTEASGRLPFKSEDAEIRYLEAADVRQGDTFRREVILVAAHRPAIDRLLDVAQRAGLKPVAIDAEPVALLRCYGRQFRRDDDQQRRIMFINVGASTTKVVIARGSQAMFVKYIDAGGRHLDEAVAHFLQMSLEDAAALRRHNGDRRVEQRDPEVTRSLHEATRPVLDRLANELSLCLRYYSVTFRGQPLSQAVLSGGEAVESLAESLTTRLDLPCELGNPLRSYQKGTIAGRTAQWDVAAGLALRKGN